MNQKTATANVYSTQAQRSKAPVVAMALAKDSHDMFGLLEAYHAGDDCSAHALIASLSAGMPGFTQRKL